jgi:hypothetical protein
MSPVDLLDQVTRQIWPRRRQQEALFDLPERKQWTRRERIVAIRDCADWLIENGVIIAHQIQTPVLSPADLTRLRANVAGRAPVADGPPGVAADLQRIAPMVGSAPKTLANSLGRFPRCDRLDHRWLVALGRLASEPLPLGLRYEDRSQAAMRTLLERVAGHRALGQLDAVDAIIIFSLIALWQRRRPTSQVRGNRRHTSCRRTAPKPLVRLCDTLILPQQVLTLLRVDHADVRTLALEAALTRAHLLPHADRVGGASTLPRLLPRLVDGADAMYRYRIAVMQAWRTRQPWPDPPSALAHHPYVINTLALAQRAWGVGLSTDELARKWNSDWPGKAMLAPALRHRMRGANDGDRRRVLRGMDQRDP